MDPETAQMMADLGLARRDFVSAPEADARGRMVREDPRQQQAIKAAFEARRAKTRDVGSAENERSARLSAWNTETTFERDAITDQLEDRFSGQGHRANLSSKYELDNKWEEIHSRYGEERALHLQDRAAGSGGNYVAGTAPRGGFGGASRATPRSFGGGNAGNRAPERGRVVSAPNPNRAPSPRSFGTVRFTPGNRRVEPTAPGSRTIASPPSAPVATRPQPIATAARTTGPTRASGQAPRTAVAATRAPPAAAATAARIVAPIRQARQPSTTATATAAPTQLPTPSATATAASKAIATGPTVAENFGHSAIEKQRFEALADWYAANPGAECDIYHDEFPDRKQYLRPAWKGLLRLAFKHASDPYGRDTETYLSTHKDRRWILEAAMKAKDFVENRTEAEMDAYYAAHLDAIDFCNAARTYFTPKPAAHTEPAVSGPAVHPEHATEMRIEQPRPANSGPVLQPQPTSTPVVQPEATTPRPAVQPTSSTRAIVQTAATTSRSAVQPKQTSSTRPIQPEPTISATVIQAAVTVSEPKLTVQPSTMPAAAVNPEDSSPPQSPSESSVETALSEPRPTTLGTISATFYDIAGEYLGVKSKPIDAPAHVHITVTSQARRFDPRDLIPQIQALAEMMQGLSNSSSSSSSSNARSTQSGGDRGVDHSLEGWRMTDDGLWEEV
ncbi:hypothetical protein LTR85_006845 [Meristemomyces frigidus]|nr:hypothetical protein LTR85_006845 [Meristemomyces frigidus]